MTIQARFLGLLRRALLASAPMFVLFGAPLAHEVTAAEATVEVVVVGDSITADNVEQVSNHVYDTVGVDGERVRFEALAARRIDASYEWHGWRSSGLDAIERVRADRIDPQLWIIELGTNDMFLVADEPWVDQVAHASALIDQVVDAIGPRRPIAWVTVLHREDPATSDAFNTALRRRAAADPTITVLDWERVAADRPEWFLDHVHPNAAGAEVLAELYADAIERRGHPPHRPDPPSPVRGPHHTWR